MSERRIVNPALQGLLTGANAGDTLSLSPEFAHYLHRVLRLDSGDAIELCDGRGARWSARISARVGEELHVILGETLPSLTHDFPIYLAQAVPKSDRMEQILQRCTELGVAGFYPFFSHRCVVKLAEKRLQKRLDRWQRIVQEACRQCQRAWMPTVEAPVSIADVMSQLPPGTDAIVCWEGERQVGLHDWIEAHPEPGGIAVFIGPEGGFEDAEIEQLVTAGVRSVGLGPAILRTETAGPAVSAILQYRYGSLGCVP